MVRSVGPSRGGESGVIGVMISGRCVGLGDGFFAIGTAEQDENPSFDGEFGVAVGVLTSKIVRVWVYFGGKEKSGNALKDDFRGST
jgi:hypothetical protein